MTFLLGPRGLQSGIVHVSVAGPHGLGARWLQYCNMVRAMSNQHFGKKVRLPGT
jgi:hypothetical protein